MDWRLITSRVGVVVLTIRIRLLRPHPELSRWQQHEHDPGLVLDEHLVVPRSPNRDLARGQVRELPELGLRVGADRYEPDLWLDPEPLVQRLLRNRVDRVVPLGLMVLDRAL